LLKPGVLCAGRFEIWLGDRVFRKAGGHLTILPIIGLTSRVSPPAFKSND
jgi:hypothetical protein